MGKLILFAGFALLASELMDVGSVVPALTGDDEAADDVTEKSPRVHEDPRGSGAD